MADTNIPQSNNGTKDPKIKKEEAIEEIIKGVARLNNKKRAKFMDYVRRLAEKFGEGKPLRRHFDALKENEKDPD